jgi:putative nucleotidyltransferase with HDIG domain
MLYNINGLKKNKYNIERIKLNLYYALMGFLIIFLSYNFQIHNKNAFGTCVIIYILIGIFVYRVVLENTYFNSIVNDFNSLKFHKFKRKSSFHISIREWYLNSKIKTNEIKLIIGVLHEKNKREEQHSYRVSKLCEDMGKALSLSQVQIKELKTVGLLHDIGKIAIEDNILNKPDKLTSDEWAEMKKHAEIGYEILNSYEDMSQMAKYVLYHHEKWDGSGYPNNLKGEEIPLQSRIIAIADSYDAMVSERCYRNALPEEFAIEQLKNNADTQFDGRLIKIFLEKVLEKKL